MESPFNQLALRSPFYGAGVAPFTPLSLFASGEQGVWYDPSDLTTLFQDASGTTPVTAVEQPVGRILDKSGRGNHATQSTSASRPVLSARVNLLTKTEQFDDAVWTKTGMTVTANATTAPDETTTAELVVPTAVSSAHHVVNAGFSSAAIVGQSYTMTFYAKAAGYSWVGILKPGQTITSFNVTNGTVGNVSTGHTNATIQAIGNGWYRCSVTETSWLSGNGGRIYCMNNDNAGIFTGDGTSGAYIWGADFRVTNEVNSLIPQYQRVNTSTDYDTTGFPLYLRFDGTDDSLATGSINFTSTDKMSVFAGVRKQISGTSAIIAELSTNASGNVGSFGSYCDDTGYTFRTGGTSPIVTTYLTASPNTSVLGLLGDISGDSLIIRTNGVERVVDTRDQGSGNFGTYPLYIGRRGGTTLPLNGRLYSLIVRGAQSDATQITDTETWVNARTKAY